MQGNYILIVPAVPGKGGGYKNGTLTPVGFSVVYGGGLRAGLLPSAYPHRTGLIPGL